MKKYTTKEECIKELGEHAWKKAQKTFIGSCLVYHADGYCSDNDPVEECYHCPARRVYTRRQPAIYEWVETN